MSIKLTYIQVKFVIFIKNTDINMRNCVANTLRQIKSCDKKSMTKNFLSEQF
jgi:hypothetical protein